MSKSVLKPAHPIDVVLTILRAKAVWEKRQAK